MIDGPFTEADATGRTELGAAPEGSRDANRHCLRNSCQQLLLERRHRIPPFHGRLCPAQDLRVNQRWFGRRKKQRVHDEQESTTRGSLQR